MSITITFTPEQNAALSEHGIDAETVALDAIADAVERAAVANVNEAVNVERRAAVEQLADVFPRSTPDTDPTEGKATKRT